MSGGLTKGLTEGLIHGYAGHPTGDLIHDYAGHPTDGLIHGYAGHLSVQYTCRILPGLSLCPHPNLTGRNISKPKLKLTI